jgi:hypothetical protein
MITRYLQLRASVHMTSLRSLALGAAAAAMMGCEKEATFLEPLPDYAAIHWVNAVPDTMQQDFRVVDIVSNAGLFDANFRANNMFYQPIEAGGRTLRIFLSSTDPVIAQTVLREEALSLSTGASYTYIHLGFARTGSLPSRSGLLIPDTPPTPAAGQVAVRVINAGAGVAGGAVDVWFVRRPVNATTADSLSDTRTFPNLAFGQASAYIAAVAPVVGVPADSLDSLRIVVAAVGTKTPLTGFGVNGIKAPNGVAGSATVNPIAGARIAGSVMSAVLLPPSVAGSQAPQGGAFVNPTAIYLVERRPANTAP